MNMEAMKKSLESLPLPTSYSTLPYDILVDILARISRVHYPYLSLVSKGFRSLLASVDLNATRSRIGTTEDFLYVCLNLNKQNPNPRWFTLAPIPERQKLLPISLCTYKNQNYSSTIVSIGSEIYIIGGYFLNGKRSRRVLVLDCLSHQWSKLPHMRVPRAKPAAKFVDGKLHVTGGCRSTKREDWGEVYDPKTRTWEQLVMGGKVDVKAGIKLFYFRKNICLVEIDKNVFCRISISHKNSLNWCDVNENLEWRNVMGLDGLYPTSSIPRRSKRRSKRGSKTSKRWITHMTPDIPMRFVSVVNPGGGRRVTALLTRQTEIWCAEISFERHNVEDLLGVVEWSKHVWTFDGCDFDFDFFVRSVMITH